MIGALLQWFQSRPFAQQVILLAAVFDPVGIAAGYVLAPSAGVEPLLGAALGAVVASVPTSLLVMARAAQG
jgi:negative regulator of sigma E activity